MYTAKFKGTRPDEMLYDDGTYTNAPGSALSGKAFNVSFNTSNNLRFHVVVQKRTLLATHDTQPNMNNQNKGSPHRPPQG